MKMNKSVLETFSNPPSRYRGAPFWAWNCKLDKDTLLKQIDYFKEMGMGGFTIHSRTGLNTPYMGEEFMDMVSACVEKAKEKQMNAYLYDEDRWPSGYGGGMVTCHEEFRSQYLVFTPYRKGENLKEAIAISGMRTNSNGQGTLLACYKVTLKDGYLEHYQVLSEDEVLNSSEDVWYLYLEICSTTPWFNNQSYVNVLDPKAMEKFIEGTHEKYYEALGNDFGGVIPSIFTDEPQMVHKIRLGKATDKSEVILPYTTGMEEGFEKKYSTSLLEHIPELVWNMTDSKISTIRYWYHDYVTDCFANSFGKVIGDWCEAHNIGLTGHMMEEPTLLSQTCAIGEAMRHYPHFAVPGIDMLCDWREYTTAKQAQSVVHQLGKSGMTSELYGVTNWDFDFRGHKLQGDWQAALGVTHRVHHLSWVSMEGEAKRDYPASIFYQSPWYKKYKVIEDHFARVNVALQDGKPSVRLGVIHPIESFWLYFGPDEHNSIVQDELEAQFENVTKWLLFGLIDFDYISEALLPGMYQGIDNNQITIGQMTYDAILVPGCKTLRRTTYDYLNEYAKHGGSVIFAGEIPGLIDALPSTLSSELAVRSTCCDFQSSQLLSALEEIRQIDIRDLRGKRTDCYLYQMRETTDGKWLFIANGKEVDNKDIPKKEELSVYILGQHEVSCFDTLDGTYKPCRYTFEEGYTIIQKEFYDHDSLLLYLCNVERNCDEDISKASSGSDKIAKELGKDERDTANKHLVVEQNANDIQAVKTLNTIHSYSLSEPNVLLLDQAEYKLDDEPFHEKEEVLIIDNILRKQLGYPLKMEALAQPWCQTDQPDSGHSITLRYTFQSDIELDTPLLAIERSELIQGSFNNQPISNIPNGWYVDECIDTLSLSPIRKGSNELLITMPYDALSNLEWCYILGEFGVKVIGEHAKITAMPDELGFGDITNQGLPFYAGNLSYNCIIDVQESDYELEVTKFAAPLLSVTLDGTAIGNIMFSPYRVNLGHLAGKHEIGITAYGNRVNTFGALHNCDESTKWFGPGAWRSEGAQYSYECQLKKLGILSAPRLHG